MTNSAPQPFPPGVDATFADAFKDPEVVSLYGLRPPYPPSVFDRLLSLIAAPPTGRILEIGAGTGEIARSLAPCVASVDAVDVSSPMLEEATRLTPESVTNIQWVLGRVEDLNLPGPYDLVVAGDSLHWMPWRIVMPKFARLLCPGAFLAIVSREWSLGDDEEIRIFRDYALGRLRAGLDAEPPAYVPVDMIGELVRRKLYRPMGNFETEARWLPTPQEYVDARHSQSSFPRSLLGPSWVEQFDSELLGLIQRLVRSKAIVARGGALSLTMSAKVTWGFCLDPAP